MSGVHARRSPYPSRLPEVCTQGTLCAASDRVQKIGIADDSIDRFQMTGILEEANG